MTKPFAVYLNFLPADIDAPDYVDGTRWHWGSYAKRETAEREVNKLRRVALVANQVVELVEG